ncbi:MAG: hypothetical protein ACLULH_13420 [Bacteroides fragilis]
MDGADYITFSWNSAFWIFNWVANMVYPRYDLMIGDVSCALRHELGDHLQRGAGRRWSSCCQACARRDPAKAKAFLTNYTEHDRPKALSDTLWKRLERVSRREAQ